MEIRPDVHLIRGRASNFYLCVDEDSLKLVDAGMPKEQHLLFDYLAKLGYRPQQINQILITHADIDHAGSLAAIQSVTGAAVFAGKETAVLLLKGKSPDHLPRLMQWIANTFFKYRAVSKSCLNILNDGDVLPVLNGLVALETPGHTNDHFSFFSPSSGILFAGDALNTRGGKLQRTEKRLTADEQDANQSAIKLIQLAPATIACGHGNPISNHDAGDLMKFFNQLRENE